MVKQEMRDNSKSNMPSIVYTASGPMMLSRLESFNKEIRDKHMRIHKIKQERREEARKRKLKEKEDASSTDPPSSESFAESDKEHTKKMNQKFSKLMSYDIESEMRQARNQIRRNNETLSTFNMRLNVGKFKPNCTTWNAPDQSSSLRGSLSLPRRDTLRSSKDDTSKGKHQPQNINKPFRVRFSLEKPEQQDEEGKTYPT